MAGLLLDENFRSRRHDVSLDNAGRDHLTVHSHEAGTLSRVTQRLQPDCAHWDELDAGYVDMLASLNILENNNLAN